MTHTGRSAAKEQVSGRQISGDPWLCFFSRLWPVVAASRFVSLNATLAAVFLCLFVCLSPVQAAVLEDALDFVVEVRWVSLIKWFSTVQQFFEKIVKCLGPLDQSDKYSQLGDRTASEQMDFLSFFYLFFFKWRTPEDTHGNLVAVVWQ